MSGISVTARVRVLLEIQAEGVWGEGCGLDQIHEQASREAVAELRRALSAQPLNGMDERARQSTAHRIRIMGEPVVEAIVAKRAG